MEPKEIKAEMLKFRDFYGMDFLDSDEIKNAKTTLELSNVFDRQIRHYEDMLSDAIRHLEDFKNKLGMHCL